MAIQIKEWIQAEWQQSNIEVFRNKGDFADLSALFPSTLDGRRLKRGPAWSAHITHTGLLDVCAMFYDDANSRFVLIGSNAADNLASVYYNAAWSMTGPAEINTTIDTLSDTTAQNFAFHGAYFYCIGDDALVYRGSSYAGAITEFYDGVPGDAKILVPMGGRLYMLLDNGDIYRLNDANNAFEAHFLPVAQFDPIYATAYRGELYIVGRQSTGITAIYHVAPLAPQVLRQVTVLPGSSYSTGSLFAVHDDKIIMSPGPKLEPDGSYTTNFYAFNGTFARHVAKLENAHSSSSVIGLLVHQEKLIYYALSGATNQTFKALLGESFVDYAPGATLSVSGISPVAGALGNQLVVTGKDGATEGVHRTGAVDHQDGYLITSKLTFDQPGRTKRLERITAILSGADTDFKVILKYRTDDTTGWTTASTANNTRIATVGALGVSFYTLQVRVDLDDDSGNDNDIRLESLSVIYTREN